MGWGVVHTDWDAKPLGRRGAEDALQPGAPSAKGDAPLLRIAVRVRTAELPPGPLNHARRGVGHRAHGDGTGCAPPPGGRRATGRSRDRRAPVREEPRPPVGMEAPPAVLLA